MYDILHNGFIACSLPKIAFCEAQPKINWNQVLTGDRAFLVLIIVYLCYYISLCYLGHHQNTKVL